jgi:hypothetical protein
MTVAGAAVGRGLRLKMSCTSLPGDTERAGSYFGAIDASFWKRGSPLYLYARDLNSARCVQEKVAQSLA